MKIKTSELIGPALDWAVAKCEGVAITKYPESPSLFLGSGFNKYRPATDWAQGGPIIEREEIAVGKGWEQWAAFKDADTEDGVVGITPLIAAMRCYVESKLGNMVDIPDEFIGG
jgi:hypothetical protein